MTATIALLTLLLAPAATDAAHAPVPPPCQSFSRETRDGPPFARAWFAHSTDERVVVCPQSTLPNGETPAPLYFGEGAVNRHGGVCSYESHGLTLKGSGDSARLQRYERSEALDMALARADCPRPHAETGTAAYVETYDITQAVFEDIMRLWSIARATVTAAADEHCCAAAGSIAPEARGHMEAALGPDHLLSSTVTRIVRIPGSALRRRYALFLTVTDSAADRPALYVVYVDKRLRAPYEITAFAETN